MTSEEVIARIIEYQKTAFISAIDEDGFPTMKAMLPPRKRIGLKTFYFTTNTSSNHVKQYLDNPKASIYFCDNRFFRGVMIKGTMEVLTDKESKEMIWNEGDEMYYSQGVSDPDYCVLCFNASSIRYYANFKSKDIEITD